ncbi:MAG: serine/threonine-protein kinase, partial [Planctomycetota bacterium]
RVDALRLRVLHEIDDRGGAGQIAPRVRHYEPAKPGTKLAGYSVLAEIGRGAASIIYLVQDTKTKRVYALKHVTKDSPKDQRFLDQAYAEAEIASRIASPRIRGIERVIKSRQKLISVSEVFLLMEYVDGISIERHPPATFADALDVFRQTAEGLGAMHDAGFVHADMKPNNIVITDDGSVKIIDLGQACPIGTIKERIQGTPDYIAPEQVHRREITPKTDVYNLGATMYWCLTRRFIPTAMPKESSLVKSLDDEQIERPQPPHEINPRIPASMSALIMDCVEVALDRRPVSMGVVAQRLAEIAVETASAGTIGVDEAGAS